MRVVGCSDAFVLGPSVGREGVYVDIRQQKIRHGRVLFRQDYRNGEAMVQFTNDREKYNEVATSMTDLYAKVRDAAREQEQAAGVIEGETLATHTSVFAAVNVLPYSESRRRVEEGREPAHPPLVWWTC